MAENNQIQLKTITFLPKTICTVGGPTPPPKKTIKINTKQWLSTKNNIPRAKQLWHAQRKHRLWNRDLNPPSLFHGATAKRRYSMESKIMPFVFCSVSLKYKTTMLFVFLLIVQKSGVCKNKLFLHFCMISRTLLF